MGLKPTYRIEANGSDITATIRQRFISLRMTDEAGLQSDALEIKLADHDPSAPIEMPPTGASLDLWLGYDGTSVRMGTFIVDAIDLGGFPDHMTIKAVASPQAGTSSKTPPMTTHKTRSWERGTTIGDMARTIAQEHGLEPAVAASLASIALPHVDQVNESDINMLTRLVRDHDAIAKPAGGKLVISKRGESQTTSGQALPVVRVHKSMVSRWGVTLNKRQEAGTVIATWSDLLTGTEEEVSVGSGEPIRRLRHTYGDAEAAKAAAEADFSQSRRAEGHVSVTLPGDPDLIAEARLELVGFRDGANGEWLITRVEHVLDAGGYRCTVSGETPPE